PPARVPAPLGWWVLSSGVFSSFFWRSSGAFMRPWPWPRPGPSLLRARPPAMTSPPAMKTAEPSRGCGGRQGAACRVADSRVVLLLLVARHEGEPAREAVHDEVVSRGVDAAVHERREQNKQSEDEGRPRAHRDVPPWSWPRRNSSTLPSQLRPSNARLESVTRSTSSRQRALTSIESGCERGT